MPALPALLQFQRWEGKRGEGLGALCSWGTPGRAATPETPQFPNPGIPKGWGAAPGDLRGVIPFLWVMELGIPPWTGEDPKRELCPTDAVWGSGACSRAPHPPHGRALGSLPQCLVWQWWLRQEQGLCHPPGSLHGPAGTCGQRGRRVRAPHWAPPCPGEDTASPLHLMLPLYLLDFFFFYCHQELTKHRAEHPRPSSPLVGPASSSGITPERSHLSPSVLGEAKTPGDDFLSSRGWVCSFLSAV